MNQITMTEMLDHLEMERNHYLGEAADMTLRRPGFEDTPKDQLNIWIGEEEHKAKIVEAIIVKVKEAEEQTYLEGVIQFLELVQKVTTYNAATFLREFESPSPAYDSEASRSHTKMLLDEAQHEIECLDVVITMLKEELEWENCEVYVAEPQEEKDRIEKERLAEGGEIEDMLAAIRKRRNEAREAMKGGV